MDQLFLWPDRPAASIALLWLASVVFLWASRDPMQRLLAGLHKAFEEGFATLASKARDNGKELASRTREALLAAGTLASQGRLDRELQRIDAAFSDRLGQYTKLHRRTDDLVRGLESEYQQCGDAPPDVPGWSAAVETMRKVADSGDPNVQKVLESIRKSSEDAEKRALAQYRDDSARRHKTLGAMASGWKEVRSLLSKMADHVAKALESAQRIDGFVDEYEKIRDDREEAARSLSYSAVKLFMVSLLVLGVALGGAFINFQLIALPMSELVPAGARIGGVPVSTVSALVIVLMETALGIFIMDMLGITDLFPKLSTVPSGKRRLILVLSLLGLFFLAAVESSLAVLREQIVVADAALKMALAGAQDTVVGQASGSMIPVIGQAVLGFVLPWILATVAIPLEMMFDSGRHVLAMATTAVLFTLGNVAAALSEAARRLGLLWQHAYDVYIGIPLRIERAVTGRREEEAALMTPPTRAAGARSSSQSEATA